MFDYTQCAQCAWINYCIPDECPGYDVNTNTNEEE